MIETTNYQKIELLTGRDITIYVGPFNFNLKSKAVSKCALGQNLQAGFKIKKNTKEMIRF